ncbi:methionine biosynthesis protein MetW [Alterisphingorhabdus coralli]|uniref:Methionine biosynthesis protein MetW n=1 Tax=Alterisphingorhabdus coralli TaxID=3071408 RepID=A0AA97F6T5_9SPHN|nr:methionine biosynthesis protein MetW [Parasphingorhabdus sp. SCSIO 66989]WOE75429.1 methionine biosynthesis protein MetW [Parasphingorhabdus sp. SCSIO 66989]
MTTNLRPDLAVIYDQIAPNSRVLDIGCGEGTLLAALRQDKAVDARGLEINPVKVATAMGKGLSVVQGDADTDLADYPAGGFDYAVLSQTLQTTDHPDRIVESLLRIGARAFVSFPNFAHWRVRLNLLTGGRMPVTRLIPERWYNTPNIHHVTIADFEDLIAERGWQVEGRWFLSGDATTGHMMGNLLAEHAVFLLRG